MPDDLSGGKGAHRHPSWVKLHYIRKHLQHTRYLVWMDADVLVMNLAVPLSVS